MNAAKAQKLHCTRINSVRTSLTIACIPFPEFVTPTTDTVANKIHMPCPLHAHPIIPSIDRRSLKVHIRLQHVRNNTCKHVCSQPDLSKATGLAWKAQVHSSRKM